MIDILLYLFENYSDFSTHPEGKALARKLSAVGFEETEISHAIDWLTSLKHAASASPPGHPHAFRIYTAEEQSRLGRECLGFLAFLENAGAVTPALREVIVMQAQALVDDRIDIEQFKVIVLMVLWSREEPLEPLILEELLAGQGVATLH